jgi:hypothetical protein
MLIRNYLAPIRAVQTDESAYPKENLKILIFGISERIAVRE